MTHTTPTLTFSQFQATRREATSEELAEQNMHLQGGGKTAYLYVDCLYIEILDEFETEEYYLPLERSEYVSTRLEELEGKLYRFAVEAGVILAPVPACTVCGGDRQDIEYAREQGMVDPYCCELTKLGYFGED